MPRILYGRAGQGQALATCENAISRGERPHDSSAPRPDRNDIIQRGHVESVKRTYEQTFDSGNIVLQEILWVKMN
jgi:hypothetical protein